MNDPRTWEQFGRLIRYVGMGEIRARVILENVVDRGRFLEGDLAESNIRRVEMEGIADTGAVLTLLPLEIVERLGLRRTQKRIVLLANDQKIELDQADCLWIEIGDRSMTTTCLIGPPGCTMLIGQVVMESLDLIVDPLKRTLTPRPESPFLPTLNLKGMWSPAAVS